VLFKDIVLGGVDGHVDIGGGGGGVKKWFPAMETATHAMSKKLQKVSCYNGC